MGNLTIHAGLVNGDLMPIIDDDKTSSEIVKAFTGDDTGAPPSSVTITVITASGKKVEIYIPNSNANTSVMVDGKSI
ncbi:hypothetical protein GWI99_17810 [Proteus sp. G2609]|uniref:hypothetical protein n=1 Tax=Proteus sp. G2609 TaxID=2698840 RepID=UPI001377CF9D|nr:hypothetical protein [Proteus sp. G2609]NBN69502.1 hypothetical protein [Proteus sp. G2609]HEK3017734.1 hypothetical protein [Proteus mirabilis]